MAELFKMAIDQAQDIDTIENIIETMANSEDITDADYSMLYGRAIAKIQEWRA